MTTSRATNKTISLWIVVAFVLGLFARMPITVSAAPLGLSMPENPHWEMVDDGSMALTGYGIWDRVDGAATYPWALLMNANGEIQDPDSDLLIAEGRLSDSGSGSTMRMNFSEFAGEHGYYYFIVAALDSNDVSEGALQWSHSDYLHYYVKPAPKPSGGSSSGGSSSSGGGSNIPDAQRTTTGTLPAGWGGATTTSDPVTQNSTTIKTIADAAKSNGQTVATSKGTGEVTVQASAWSQLSGLSFRHDTVVDGAVQVRVTINNPATITNDLKVSGYATGQTVNRVRNTFDKYFSNTTSVVYLDQAGSWGQEVRIAAKVDLTGINTNNLVFYSYDGATNSYYRITNPNYTIDANGYIHFSTQYAGSIVISDGPLVKK